MEIDVEAVQAANFEPDFASEDPWYGCSVIKFVKESGGEILEERTDTETMTVSFSGDAKKLVSSTDNFFEAFGTLQPGDTREGSVTICNTTDQTQELTFSMEAANGGESRALLAQMDLTIRSKDEVLYSGSAADAEDAGEISLGSYEAGEKGEITFSLYTSEEIDNALACAGAQMNWKFLATAQQEEEQEAAKTGDNGKRAWFYLLLITAMVGVLVKVRQLLHRGKRGGKRKVPRLLLSVLLCLSCLFAFGGRTVFARLPSAPLLFAAAQVRTDAEEETGTERESGTEPAIGTESETETEPQKETTPESVEDSAGEGEKEESTDAMTEHETETERETQTQKESESVLTERPAEADSALGGEEEKPEEKESRAKKVDYAALQTGGSTKVAGDHAADWNHTTESRNAMILAGDFDHASAHYGIGNKITFSDNSIAPFTAGMEGISFSEKRGDYTAGTVYVTYRDQLLYHNGKTFLYGDIKLSLMDYYKDNPSDTVYFAFHPRRPGVFTRGLQWVEIKIEFLDKAGKPLSVSGYTVYKDIDHSQGIALPGNNAVYGYESTAMRKATLSSAYPYYFSSLTGNTGGKDTAGWLGVDFDGTGYTTIYTFVRPSGGTSSGAIGMNYTGTIPLSSLQGYLSKSVGATKETATASSYEVAGYGDRYWYRISALVPFQVDPDSTYQSIVVQDTLPDWVQIISCDTITDETLKDARFAWSVTNQGNTVTYKANGKVEYGSRYFFDVCVEVKERQAFQALPAPDFNSQTQRYSWENTAVYTVDSVQVSSDPVLTYMPRQIRVEIQKRDKATGEGLAGAMLRLETENGEPVREFLSQTTPEVLERIAPGTYVLRELTAPPGYLAAAPVSFTVQNRDDTQTIFMDDLPCSTITVTKKIRADETVWAHGNPTFLFQVKGEDLDGVSHTYNGVLSFDEEHAEADADGTYRLSHTFFNVPAGIYTVTERQTLGYELLEVLPDTSNVTAEAVQGDFDAAQTGRVQADVTRQRNAGVTFVNRKQTFDGYRHTSVVVNRIGIAERSE